jgi:hypothetical protein
MNASELTENFWKYNRKEPLGAVAVALYLFLIEIWKKNKENDFRLSDTEICERLKISRPTIIALRQKLVTAGMIQYQPKNGVPGHYKIHLEYSPTFSVFAKPETKKAGSTIKSIQKIISKKKKITEKSSQKIEVPKNENLSSDDLTEKLFTIPISLPSNIPSLEEFTQYAKLLDNYVPEMDHLIKEKYDSWIGNGWKNGYDKPITNWKSSLKNIMPFLQSELQSSNATSEKIALPTIKRPKSSIDE